MTSIVDHIIIAVEDLAQATDDYSLMLGRAQSWRGTHPDYGSANSLFRIDIRMSNCWPPMAKAGRATWCAT